MKRRHFICDASHSVRRAVLVMDIRRYVKDWLSTVTVLTFMSSPCRLTSPKLTSGVISLAGLSGGGAGDMRLRTIAIVGYAGGFLVAVGLMAT